MLLYKAVVGIKHAHTHTQPCTEYLGSPGTGALLLLLLQLLAVTTTATYPAALVWPLPSYLPGLFHSPPNSPDNDLSSSRVPGPGVCALCIVSSLPMGMTGRPLQKLQPPQNWPP